MPKVWLVKASQTNDNLQRWIMQEVAPKEECHRVAHNGSALHIQSLSNRIAVILCQVNFQLH
jgi:hypothetical protein